jgi:5-methylcytosine-specific restriction endonuclease McrA
LGQRNFKPRHKTSGGKEFNNKAHWRAMYDSAAWRSYRLRFLAENPECYACGKPATQVDHLIPHKGDVRLFEKVDNHLPLCESCHSIVTKKFDKFYVAGHSIEPKIKWLNKGRIPTDEWTPRKVRVLPSYKK